MAVYFTDFSEYTTGAQPSDWTARWTTSGETWAVREKAGELGGKGLEHTRTTTARRLLSWDDIDADADRDNSEILVRWRSTAIGADNFSCVLRGSGAAGTEQGYIFHNATSSTIRISRLVAGAITAIASVSITTLVASEWYWMRFRVNGTDLKAKFWAGENVSEPAAWSIETTDANIAGDGWVGVGNSATTGTRDYDDVAIGTNGDTAAFPVSDDVRITQAPFLVLSAADSDARITQSAVLVLGELMEAAPTRITQVATLALVGFDAGIRVTQTAILVLADQVNCLTKWAQIWTITRTDGEVFAFTSHDMPITFRGVVHSPCDSLSASAVELSSLTGSTGSMELMGIISDTSVTEADLYNGLFDSATIEVWMVPWDNENGDIPFRLIAGQTGKLSHGVEGFEFEVLANATKLKQKSLIDVYTPGCRYNFGTQNDPRCPVDLTTIDVTGSVTGLAVPNAGTSSTRRIFTDSSRTEADGFFEFGKVTWTSGANIGVVSEVKDFNAKTFVLWNATLTPIAVGDTYTATPGCDKSRTDHLAFNANMIDYGGFEDVPGTDAVLQTPDAKG